MVKTALFVGFALAVCLAQPASAARKFDLFIQPNFTSGFGNTEYVLDEDGYVAPGVLGHVKSELKFPVTAMYSGLTFGLRSKPQARVNWSVLATYSLGIRDPRSRMFDGDWMNWPGRIDSMISSTDSDVEQKARFWSIEARVSVIQGNQHSRRLCGGLSVSEDSAGLDQSVRPPTG